MDIKLLEEFMLVSKQGSLRKAASVLKVSPAALSQRMTALEASIGTALFERTNRQTRLTVAGERLSKEVEHYLTQYNKSISKVITDDEHLYASVKIAITADLIPFPLAAVLDSLNFRYPNLHIELFDDRMYPIEESLDSGKVDLYFTFCYDEQYKSDICISPITNMHTYAIFRMDHKLAKKATVTLKELNGEQFILYPSTNASHIRKRQLELLATSGISYSIYDTSTPHNLYTYLLPIGKGVMLSPWQLHGKLTPNSVAIPLNEAAGESTYAMLYKKDSANPALQSIVAEILDEVRELTRR